jgi:hypothetical protein
MFNSISKSIVMMVEALIILVLTVVVVYLYSDSVDCKASNLVAKQDIKKYKSRFDYSVDNIDDVSKFYETKIKDLMNEKRVSKDDCENAKYILDNADY